MINEEKISEYIAKSVESGVKPLELYFEPIYDCYYGELNSFRAGLKINSIISGTLKAEDYLNSGLSFGVMNELSLRAINKAVAAAEKLNDGGSDFKWLSVKCSSSLIKEKDLYKKLVEIKGGNFAHAAEIEGQTTIGSNSENGGLSAKNGAYKQVSTPLNQGSASSAQKVCVEFGAEVMKENASDVNAAFNDIRSAGMLVAVSGYGGEDFPLEKLLNVCPDYLYLDKKITRLASDREKQLAVAPIINLARTLGGEVIVTDLTSDEELKEFKARECVGFIPGEGYKGILNIPEAKEYSLKDILKLKRV